MLKLESIFLLRHRGGNGNDRVSLSLSFSATRRVNRLGEEENFGGGEGGWHCCVPRILLCGSDFFGLVRNFY